MKTHGAISRCGRLNTTGVIGVALCPVRIRRAHDVVTRHYYHATAGRVRRRFCVETLGRREAFRRAVAMRAAYEREVGSQQSADRSQQSKNPTQTQ